MMKLKSNQTRTYDGDGYKKRAACLCFRSETEEEVLLVSSSRHPDKWIVPGGGMEPEEEPNVAAVREVCEEAGVKGTLGRLVGIFENRDRKHRTYVYVLIVKEVLEDWEDSVNIGRKREWFKIDDAIQVLQCHKPVQATYFEALQEGCLTSNGTPLVATIVHGDVLCAAVFSSLKPVLPNHTACPVPMMRQQGLMRPQTASGRSAAYSQQIFYQYFNI
uniref:diphosphoinositol-polyphosphate diphosphatase n=1 Tax=Pygocentrus nattereri TaxID=42514 RepID=A0AAR2KCE2_PYGNA